MIKATFLLCAYWVGVVLARKIERACDEDLAFRVLTVNHLPDHSLAARHISAVRFM